METSAARAGKNNAARVVGNLRRDLVGEVDTQVPEFAQARNAFSTRQKMIDALTEGRRVFDRGIAPDELASTLNGMTAGERDMFQHGARMALADAQKDSAGAATRILEKNWNKAKLAQVVGPQQAEDFLRNVRAFQSALGSTRFPSILLAAKAARSCVPSPPEPVVSDSTPIQTQNE
jgi:hypothetical protein